MKKIKTIVVLFAIVAAAGAQAGDAGRVEFSPAKGVQAVLTVTGREVELNFYGQGGSATETIAVDTEKKLRVKIEDYNFDGYKDFSIVHNQYRTCQARY